MSGCSPAWLRPWPSNDAESPFLRELASDPGSNPGGRIDLF